jgi:hypothetical protein
MLKQLLEQLYRYTGTNVHNILYSCVAKLLHAWMDSFSAVHDICCVLISYSKSSNTCVYVVIVFMFA